MRIKKDEIIAYQFDNELVCSDCATEDEVQDATAQEIICEAEFERNDDLLFCDRCKERIAG